MAGNTGKNHRKGAVRDRTQTVNPKTGLYVKRDSTTGQFKAVKKDGKPFKGVTKEELTKLSTTLKKLSDYDKGKSRAIEYLELQDFEDFVIQLIAMRSDFTEDIPPFETRYKGQLESILAQIQSNYFGKELYPGVVNKASWMFYCLIKDHPFMNGNKRIAVVALFYFLKRNTSELYLNEEALMNGLFRMAIRTAEGSPQDIEKTKRYLKRKIRSFILQR